MWIGSRKWSAECFNIIVKLLLIAFDYMVTMGIIVRKCVRKKEGRTKKNKSPALIWTEKGNHIRMANALKLKHLNIIAVLRGKKIRKQIASGLYMFHWRAIHTTDYYTIFLTNMMAFWQRSDFIWCTCMYTKFMGMVVFFWYLNSEY